MTRLMLLVVGAFSILHRYDAFYQSFNQKDITTVTPKDIKELTKFLCNKFEKGKCVDKTRRKIIINKIFDFTEGEKQKKEKGCYHKVNGNCKTTGQLKLNVANQCKGLQATDVSFYQSGRTGLDVGSNKVIVGIKKSGFKGKGLRLMNSHNVEIRNLKITDINAHVVWGGDAIDLHGVKNVLIDGNYIARIGRQMIVSHYGSSKQVMISNNVFDGESSHSATCNGQHYWLWLFLGEKDEIALYNNVIRKVSGRAPKVNAQNGAKTVIHMIQNVFTDVQGSLIDLADKHSSMLIEGNTFNSVHKIVLENKGHIWMPQNQEDQKKCKEHLGRDCLPNVIKNSKGDKPINNAEAMKDVKKLFEHSAKPLSTNERLQKLTALPNKLLGQIKTLI